ncbi:MAG: hypothetical protein ACXVIM_06890 [Acidimicrobiia bacterium]
MEVLVEAARGVEARGRVVRDAGPTSGRPCEATSGGISTTVAGVTLVVVVVEVEVLVVLDVFVDEVVDVELLAEVGVSEGATTASAPAGAAKVSPRRSPASTTPTRVPWYRSRYVSATLPPQAPSTHGHRAVTRL